MANFPTSVSTNANLYISVNGLQTTLAVTIISSDTTIQLASTTGFPTTGLVTIENNEVVSYTGISGANLTGCTRGADGTTAIGHNAGVVVGATIVAAHHNLLKDEVIAIETALGANLVNVQPAGNYITALTSDVSASGPGSVAATVNSVGGSSATNVHNAELAANAATNANTVSTIVKRDSSGNFSAGTITAALTGAASSNVLKAGDTMTGDLTMDNDKAIIFKESTGSGTDSVTVKAPSSVTTSYTIQLPPAVASPGQVLTDAAGNGVLSWSTAGTGTVTSVSGTTNEITSTGGTTPVLAIANPLTLPGAMTAGGAIAMATNKITGLGNGTSAQDAMAFGQNKIIQIVVGTTTTTTTTSSSSPVSTSCTVNITPTSSSNKVLIWAVGLAATASSAAQAIIDIYRSATQITASQATYCSTASGTEAFGSISLLALDSPASTATLTYLVKIANNGTGNIQFGNGSTQTIVVMEVVA